MDNTANGNASGHLTRDPSATHAWLIGGGIASLAAAVHLITDAHVPASQIHVLEARPTPGGSMAALPRASPRRKGYVIRAARKLNFTYNCFYDTLSRIPYPLPGPPESPSETDEGFEKVNAEEVKVEEMMVEEVKVEEMKVNDDKKDPQGSLLDYIRSGQSQSRSRGRAKVRLVSSGPDGPETVDTRTMGLDPQHQASLMALILRSEECLGASTVRDAFEIDFFETIFWDMVSTMYLFKPWHGAVEFRRCLLRFLHEVPGMGSMRGVEYMPMNDFDAAIVPMVEYLKDQGVDFQYDTAALSLDFAPGTDEVVVSNLVLLCGGAERNIAVKPTDVVLATLGSMVSGSRPGTNDSPPPPRPIPSRFRTDPLPDPAWDLWLRLADPSANRHAAHFGDPRLFHESWDDSMGVAFTVTLFESSFIHHLLKWAGAAHTDGTCPLLSFRDSPWLLSVTVPRQPYFADQDADTTVFWGYGLYPDQPGRFVRKPMVECSGREILTELLGLMDYPLSPTLENSITLPELMPLITSPYVTRKRDSRPRVVPGGAGNLGLMGQYVEMERDVTFTMEYSVRSAQVAVYGLMGVDKKAAKVHGGDPTAAVLGEALKAMMI